MKPQRWHCTGLVLSLLALGMGSVQGQQRPAARVTQAATPIPPVKDISVGRLPRGICFDHAGKIAYIAIMGGTTLVRIDPAQDHKKVGAITAGVTPRHIVCQQDDKTLFVSNNLPGTITRIDLDKQKAVATIPVGKMPRTIALAPQGDLLYVCNYQSGNLGIVDTARNRQIQQIKTHTHPIGVTVSPDGRFIWVSSYNTSVIQVFERKYD